MICKKCGTRFTNDYEISFCPLCGAPLYEEEDMEQEEDIDFLDEEPGSRRTVGAETTRTASGSRRMAGAEMTRTASGSRRTAGTEATRAVSGSGRNTRADTTKAVSDNRYTARAETTKEVPGSGRTAKAETTKEVSGSERTAKAETTKKVPGSGRTAKTIVADHTLELGGAFSEMETVADLEFSVEDFEMYGNFDQGSSNSYGIEVPGETSVQQRGTVSARDATVVLTEQETSAALGSRTGRSAYAGSTVSGTRRDSSTAARGENSAASRQGSSQKMGYNASAAEARRDQARKRSQEEWQKELDAITEENVRQETQEEKYFPHGFLEEGYEDERPQSHGHSGSGSVHVGVLSILTILLGIGVIGYSWMVFGDTGGLNLVWAFFDTGAATLVENLNDITYFLENTDVTWELYYEIMAVAMGLMILSTVFVALNGIIKNIVLGIAKGILLLFTGVGMAFMGIGYCAYFLITLGSDYLSTDLTLLEMLSALGGVAAAGLGAALAGLICFLYMFIWGLSSFFRNFGGVLKLIFLAILFFCSFALMIFNLYTLYESGTVLLTETELAQTMSTPILMILFLIFAFLATLEDYFTKRQRW